MTSIEEFYFRYFSNRLLREGYISQQEYQFLMNQNNLEDGLKANIDKVHSPKSTDMHTLTGYNGHRVDLPTHPQSATLRRYAN